MRANLLLASLVLSVALLPHALIAQQRGFDIDVAAGVALGSAESGSDVRRGPSLRLGVVQRDTTGVMRARLELEYTQINSQRLSRAGIIGTGEFATTDVYGQRGLSVNYSALIGRTSRRIFPYAITGVGVEMLQPLGPDAGAGLLTLGRLGAGVSAALPLASHRNRLPPVRVTLEIVSSFWLRALIPDNGGLHESAVWPITVGVRF